MAFSYIASNSAVGNGVTSLSCNLPAGTAPGDLMVIAYAFEGVAGGSSPWIIPNVGQNNDGVGPFNAWAQYVSQAPSGSGDGLEVWAAIFSSGTAIVGYFAAAQNVVAVISTYRGEYNPNGLISGAPPRLAPSSQVTGNQPAAPSVAANVGELVIAVASDSMTGAAFGTPSGFANRVDQARAGAGTVEATMADRIATVAGSTGPITFPNAAASSSTLGTTATLVFVPTPTVAGAGPIFDAPLPADLDLADGWTIRVTAIDPVTGAIVSGVTVSNFAMEVVDVNGVGAPGLAVGDFELVPGPGA